MTGKYQRNLRKCPSSKEWDRIKLILGDMRESQLRMEAKIQTECGYLKFVQKKMPVIISQLRKLKEQKGRFNPNFVNTKITSSVIHLETQKEDLETQTIAKEMCSVEIQANLIPKLHKNIQTDDTECLREIHQYMQNVDQGWDKITQPQDIDRKTKESQTNCNILETRSSQTNFVVLSKIGESQTESRETANQNTQTEDKLISPSKKKSFIDNSERKIIEENSSLDIIGSFVNGNEKPSFPSRFLPAKHSPFDYSTSLLKMIGQPLADAIHTGPLTRINADGRWSFHPLDRLTQFEIDKIWRNIAAGGPVGAIGSELILLPDRWGGLIVWCALWTAENHQQFEMGLYAPGVDHNKVANLPQSFQLQVEVDLVNGTRYVSPIHRWKVPQFWSKCGDLSVPLRNVQQLVLPKIYLKFIV